MQKYGKIKVYKDNGSADTWEARKGDCDGYALDGTTDNTTEV